jgi:hypothetical protein
MTGAATSCSAEVVLDPAHSPELQPAEHLWPLTNTVLANHHFASMEELEDNQTEHCGQLCVTLG